MPYRELLNVPGVARAHDLQRVLSYGLGAVVVTILDLPAWRLGVVFALSAFLCAAAVLRLFGRATAAPYPLALTDLFLAGFLVAIATGSAMVAAGVVAVVTIAITASFAAPRIVATAATAAAFLVTLPTAAGLSRDPGSAGDSMVAFVLVVLLLAIAVLILGFFTVQARQLRHNLTKREAQLDSVLAVTPVVLATVDNDGVVTALAGEARGWIGNPGHRIDAASEIADVVRSAQDGHRVIRDVAVGDRVFSVTCDPGHAGSALLTAYDITERTEARRRLEGLVRSKDQFIAAVSHELRTPLAAVFGFAEEVRDAMPVDDPLMPMVEVMADQSAEMAAIIEDLLVVARSSFDDVPLAPRTISLAEEVSSVADSVGSRLRKRPEFRLAHVVAYADPIRVRQIVRNLLTNADRYGGDQVVIAAAHDGNESVLEFCDSGPALPPDLRERIFEPYESSGPVGGQPAAIGLGLAVSRTLAELMEGTLRYHHRNGWSIFELRLPSAAPDASRGDGIQSRHPADSLGTAG